MMSTAEPDCNLVIPRASYFSPLSCGLSLAACQVVLADAAEAAAPSSFIEHEMRAIYEYLKAVPCIQGNYPGIGGPLANIPPEPADRCTE
jgi:hypothetical protein